MKTRVTIKWDHLTHDHLVTYLNTVMDLIGHEDKQEPNHIRFLLFDGLLVASITAYIIRQHPDHFFYIFPLFMLNNALMTSKQVSNKWNSFEDTTTCYLGYRMSLLSFVTVLGVTAAVALAPLIIYHVCIFLRIEVFPFSDVIVLTELWVGYWGAVSLIFTFAGGGASTTHFYNAGYALKHPNLNRAPAKVNGKRPPKFTFES